MANTNNNSNVGHGIINVAGAAFCFLMSSYFRSGGCDPSSMEKLALMATGIYLTRAANNFIPSLFSRGDNNQNSSSPKILNNSC